VKREAAALLIATACVSLLKNLVLWQGASPHKIGHAMEPQEFFDET